MNINIHHIASLTATAGPQGNGLKYLTLSVVDEDGLSVQIHLYGLTPSMANRLVEVIAHENEWGSEG